MKRFFGESQGDNIKLDGSEFNHLKKVLRMKEGDKVIACINDEYDYYCTVVSMGKNDCLLEINEKKICEALPNRDITLFQMLPKKDYLDNIIAKSIELGVSKIVPFTSEYTMIKDIKKERVDAQIMTACKQCERSKLIEFAPVTKLEKLPQMLSEYDLVLFAYEDENNLFEPKLLENKQKIAIIIGNEAGFSQKEAELLKNYSTSISLGKRILRCDTAVTATLALVSILTKN